MASSIALTQGRGVSRPAIGIQRRSTDERHALLVGLLVLSASCGQEPDLSEGSPGVTSTSAQVAARDPAPTYGHRVVRTYPHDSGAFTQGLVFSDGYLYESTGLKGQSSLRKVDLETGEVLRIQNLPSQYFGEGIALLGGRIVQLTWTSRIGFVYDQETFSLLREFRYAREGWGLTTDGERLIMSDGSSILHIWNPSTFEEIGHLQVTDAGFPVARLNELEYIQGEIYANIWQSDRIARISPETGVVRSWIDLTGLLSPQDLGPMVDVLNGIAYDADLDRLFVTGKNWPKLFEIDIADRAR